MKKKSNKFPVKFFVINLNKFTNNIIVNLVEKLHLNTEIGELTYKKKPHPAWEANPRLIKALEDARVEDNRIKYETYAEINERVQRWRLLEKSVVRKAKTVRRLKGIDKTQKGA